MKNRSLKGAARIIEYGFFRVVILGGLLFGLLNAIFIFGVTALNSQPDALWPLVKKLALVSPLYGLLVGVVFWGFAKMVVYLKK